MPRRPRSLSRENKVRGTFDKTKLSLDAKSRKRPSPDDEGDSDDEHTQSTTSFESHSDADILHGSDDEELDLPRVAQWVGEDELAQEDDSNAGPSDLSSLKNDLSSMPLGALRKAQRMLAQAEVEMESEDSEDVPELVYEPREEQGKEREKVEWSLKPNKELAKRANKHAPMEVTSKRPVTRKRTVVDVKMAQERDPRFLPLAGEFSVEKFRRGYAFLSESHKRELGTLRDNLKNARKLLPTSPRDIYQERANEVQRLEQAVKRAESLVNKDKRDQVDQEALTKAKHEEMEKRKRGKGDWHMKESTKRELLMKARYESLAVDGGKRAVKKAIEKKQKKIGQKEKKSRPFVKDGTKRRRVG